MADSAESPTASAESNDTDATFAIGDVARDREDDDPDDAIVVNRLQVPANEWTASGETTVAEDNPEYPADTHFVVVGFAAALQESFPDWDRKTPLVLASISNSDASHYAFPAPRLAVVESNVPDSESPSSDAESDRGGAADVSL